MTVRPPTPAPPTQSQSQQPLQLPAQSQPFSKPQHQVSQGAISSGFEQVPQFTPLRYGFTPQSASQLVWDSSIDPHLSFTYRALTGDPTPPPLQAPAAFKAPVTTTERLSSSVASSKQLAPSSTVPETAATATESVPASSASDNSRTYRADPEHFASSCSFRGSLHLLHLDGRRFRRCSSL